MIFPTLLINCYSCGMYACVQLWLVVYYRILIYNHALLWFFSCRVPPDQSDDSHYPRCVIPLCICEFKFSSQISWSVIFRIKVALKLFCTGLVLTSVLACRGFVMGAPLHRCFLPPRLGYPASKSLYFFGLQDLVSELHRNDACNWLFVQRQ